MTREIIKAKTFNFGMIDYDTKGVRSNRAEVTLELRETDKGPELSICGGIWNRRRTDYQSCGQNLDTLREFLSADPKFVRLYALWSRWHLNGMRAACEHQRARGETWAANPSAVCPDCGYKLGSAWLHEPLPINVLLEIESLCTE